MSKKKSPSGNVKFATLFSLLVVGLIALSLILRLFLIVGASRFDGSSSIVIRSVQEGKSQLINFTPKNSTISILSLEDNITPVSHQLPVDASFKSESVTKDNLSEILSKKILDFNDQKDLTFMDFLRLFFYANTVKAININEDFLDKDKDSAVVNKIVTSLFSDPTIVEEKKNIEVINSTETPGLGNRLGNLINNMGGNVILVTSGDLEKKSRIEYLHSSYTAKRLSKLLNFPLIDTKKKGVPDVIIIIGEDALSNLKF